MLLMYTERCRSTCGSSLCLAGAQADKLYKVSRESVELNRISLIAKMSRHTLGSSLEKASVRLLLKSAATLPKMECTSAWERMGLSTCMCSSASRHVKSEDRPFYYICIVTVHFALKHLSSSTPSFCKADCCSRVCLGHPAHCLIACMQPWCMLNVVQQEHCRPALMHATAIPDSAL